MKRGESPLRLYTYDQMAKAFGRERCELVYVFTEPFTKVPQCMWSQQQIEGAVEQDSIRRLTRSAETIDVDRDKVILRAMLRGLA